jgi:hypothetical protein
MPIPLENDHLNCIDGGVLDGAATEYNGGTVAINTTLCLRHIYRVIRLHAD